MAYFALRFATLTAPALDIAKDYKTQNTCCMCFQTSRYLIPIIPFFFGFASGDYWSKTILAIIFLHLKGSYHDISG